MPARSFLRRGIPFPVGLQYNKKKFEARGIGAHQGVEKMETHAQFIWHGGDSIPNEICVFRRNFAVERPVEEASALIAAETRYYLWLNGRQVVFEGGLFRESAPGCGWGDVVDLAPYLKAGENRLTAFVYYYGNGGRCNVRLPQGGFLLDCPALSLRTGEGFLCRRHPAFFTPGEPKPSYLYGGDNLGYDARLDPDPAFESAEGFEPAVPVDSAIFGELHRRPIPQFRVEEETPLRLVPQGNGEYRAKLPYAMAMLPVLYVTARGGERIDVRTDRYEVPGGPGDDKNRYRGHRLEFVCRPGENRFESLIPLFGEELVLRADPSVEMRAAACRNTGYDADFTGSFACSEPLVNTLVEKAARTLYVCMRDNFMDCPDRERGQWIGDVSVQVPQAAFLLDERAMRLVRKAVRDFITLRHGDVLVGNVPGEHASELPCQSLTALSEWGMLAQYWKYSGDAETLRLAFLPAVRYLALWKIGEDGLVVPRKGNWQWYDHLFNCDGPVIENAWMISALRFLRRAADILGDHSQDEFLNGRLSVLTAAFEKEFWRGNRYASSDALTDDRANALAVLARVCPQERYPAIRRVLVSVMNSSIYMENFVLTALCEMGYCAEALRRMLSRYYPLAVNENSTLWEDFSILGTKNHAWSGAPATIAFRYFMGIDIDAPSGRFTVSPCRGLFDKMECRFRFGGKTYLVKAEGDAHTVTAL